MEPGSCVLRAKINNSSPNPERSVVVLPSQVAFHPGPLPKTGLGKVMRRALRAPAGQGGPA